MVREWAQDAYEQAADEDDYDGLFTRMEIARRLLADTLKDFFEGLEQDVVEEPRQTTREQRLMLTDIGSLYRVEWFEVAEHWLEDIETA